MQQERKKVREQRKKYVQQAWKESWRFFSRVKQAKRKKDAQPKEKSAGNKTKEGQGQQSVCIE